MIQYLHSMVYRIETGGMNPSGAERVSQTVGADRDKNRVGFVPALPCQESRFKKTTKGVGRGEPIGFTSTRAKETSNATLPLSPWKLSFSTSFSEAS